jgi:hypothetical protein
MRKGGAMLAIAALLIMMVRAVADERPNDDYLLELIADVEV